MGMNLMNLMKQVQNVQKKAEAMQEELANLEIVGESGGGAVKVICNGQGRFQSIKISPEAMNDSADMLEDLISAAIKQAEDKASSEMQARTNAITGGIKIPGLNFGK